MIVTRTDKNRKGKGCIRRHREKTVSHLHHGTEAWDSVPLTALRQAIPEDSFILRFFQRPEIAFLIFKPPGAWSPRNACSTADAWAGERLGTGGRKAL